MIPSKRIPSTAKMFAIVSIGLLATTLLPPTIVAQQRETAPATAIASCDEFLPAKRLIGGKLVGPDACAILSDETVFNVKGQPFRRLELRISGTVAGWAAKAGPRGSYFNDAPDLVFTQSGNSNPRYAGIGRYEAATGHGISLFIPRNATDWNGKLLVTAHGAGPYGAVGTLIARDPDADFNPLTNANRYVGLMLDRGFAVAHTMRSSHLAGGDVAVTLDDGTVLPNNNVSSHGGFITDFTAIAENIVARNLGRASQRRYFYGFSAGAMMGRLIQYQPGANIGGDGRRLFDAFLLDDAGGGMWLPVLKTDGKDTLFAGDDAKRFVHQIDLSHQLYLGDDGGFLQRKRDNAKLLQQKGLGDRHRMYEIRGVSHFDAGQTLVPELVPQTLDLGGLMESVLDLLDRWVEKGVAPPPTKSDLADVAGADRARTNQNAAIALPEVACPLGIYHAFPPVHGDGRRGFQETAFAAFDGASAEPLDGRGKFVDMNLNGVRDQRETMAQAWARLGLLKSGERLDRRRYVACVANAAAQLVEQGLLPQRVLAYYARRATASIEQTDR